MNVKVQKISDEDVAEFSELIKIFVTVFEVEEIVEPDKKHLQSLLKNPNFFVVVAKEGEKVVGGLTVHVLHSYYTARPVAYIYDVGILPSYQRQGIGKQLILFLTAYCKQNGFESAYVEAEDEDSDAVNFYRKTPFDSELVARHFTYLIQ